MAEVVPLHGACVATNDVCEDVVALLESYLAEARKGEIIGISIAVVEGNNNLSTQWSSGRADRHLLLAAVTLLQQRCLRSVIDDVADAEA